MPRLSALGGTLRRIGPDRWEWADGTPAPEVTDLKPSHYYNFRVRTDGSRRYVEVPVSLIATNPDLAWCAKGGHRLGVCHDTTEGAMAVEREGVETADARKVILVPLGDWDRWNDVTAIGASWDGDGAAILARARELGWQG